MVLSHSWRYNTGRLTIWTRNWVMERRWVREKKTVFRHHSSHPQRLSELPWHCFHLLLNLQTNAMWTPHYHIHAPFTHSHKHTHTTACQCPTLSASSVMCPPVSLGDFSSTALHKVKVCNLFECAYTRVLICEYAVRMRWLQKVNKWRIISLYIVFISWLLFHPQKSAQWINIVALFFTSLILTCDTSFIFVSNIMELGYLNIKLTVAHN